MTKEHRGKKVLVAMSGGVDSSVTAVLLRNQGYDIVGVHLQLWNHSDTNVKKFGGRCCSIADSDDARRICDKVDAPFFVVNASQVFLEKVVDDFVHEYLAHRTPNPCIQCNRHIKFNFLFEKAKELGCDWVATGHYSQVKVDPITGIARLHKATDPQKDQSYFLYTMNQEILKRTLMPLGGFPKTMVRKLAQEFGLIVADKPDSQEICFVGDEGYQQFVEGRSPSSLRPKGSIVTVDGELVGEHDGLYRYTIGQRRGLQLGTKETESFYVVGFDQTASRLIVGPEKALYHQELTATGATWVRPLDRFHEIRCKGKIRSRHDEAACVVQIFENDVVTVRFEEPQRAITPGQAVVFYDGDEVLGGAVIHRVGCS